MREISTDLLPKMSKAKMSSFLRELDVLLTKLHEDTAEAKRTYREIDKLKRSNDRSFERMRRAVEKLESY